MKGCQRWEGGSSRIIQQIIPQGFSLSPCPFYFLDILDAPYSKMGFTIPFQMLHPDQWVEHLK